MPSLENKTHTHCILSESVGTGCPQKNSRTEILFETKIKTKKKLKVKNIQFNP